jgi:hypothetical protein
MKQIPDLKSLLADFYRRIDKEILPDKNVKFHEDDFDINLFSQTWGSTALGLGGFGGMAITEAYTTVILYMPSDIYGIYFGDEFAYHILNPNEKFYHDLMGHNMTSIHDYVKYEDK